MDGKVCNISLYGTELEKVALKSYDGFRLFFPKRYNLRFEETITTYEQLLDYFKKNGLISSYENLDKEFQEIKYTHGGFGWGTIANFFSKHWSDYGYDKGLVIINSIRLFFIFFGFNLLFFERLLKGGYTVEKIARANMALNKKYGKNRRILKSWVQIRYVFVYTCYIFWGIRLNVEKLGIRKFSLFIYVMLQYTVGIVCLAYIANIILTE
jgi:uncharacterized membrane protein